jgi:phage-related protein
MPEKELDIKLKVSAAGERIFSNTAAKASKLKSSLGTTRTSMTKLGAAAKRMAKAFAAPISMAGKLTAKLGGLRNVAASVGGILRGALTAGLMAVVGAGMMLGPLFGSMREAMEGGEEAAGGAGGALDDMADSATKAAGKLGSAANAGEKAVEKIKGVFGAFGAVGEGYVQTQGRLAESAEASAEGAVSTAKDVGAAMEAAQGGIDGASESTSRFGKALDRIGSAFDRAKTKILQAIAKAITPALEALADLMESPEFEAFVDLLANDLANAAKAIADWFIKKVIPALSNLMKKINEAGGPVEFLKKKFGELKTTALMILAIIVGKVLIASNRIRDYFGRIGDKAKAVWDNIKNNAADMVSDISKTFTSIVDSVKSVFNRILDAVEKAVNAMVDPINEFIGMFNRVSEAIGGAKLEYLHKINLPSLARGGIVDRPMIARVGDAPSGPEVVAPLRDLVNIIKDALGGAGLTIHVAVPAGTANPTAFGRTVGNEIALEMRRQGIRVPTI